jgi:hypothetical protein
MAAMFWSIALIFLAMVVMSLVICVALCATTRTRPVYYVNRKVNYLDM